MDRVRNEELRHSSVFRAQMRYRCIVYGVERLTGRVYELKDEVNELEEAMRSRWS